MQIKKLGILMMSFTLLTSTAVSAGDSPPKNWRKQVEKFLKSDLKDPYSAKFSDWKLVKSPMTWRLIMGLKQEPTELRGYQVCVHVNAKNAYGAYTGNNLEIVLLTEDGTYNFDALQKSSIDRMNLDFHSNGDAGMEALLPAAKAMADYNMSAAREPVAACNT